MFKTRVKQISAIGTMILALCAVPSTARAQSAPNPENHWYLGLGGGAIKRVPAEDKIGAATVFKNPGFDLGLFIGHKWADVRVEAEMLYVNNNNAREIVTGAFDEEGHGNIGLRFVFANVSYDFGHSKKWKPFAGVGVGFFHSEVHGLTSFTLAQGVPGFFGPTVVDTVSPETPAWNFKAGVGYHVSDKTELFIAGRYIRGNDFRIDSPTLGILEVNGATLGTIEAGFRVKF
jgi:opacity protein-like surface antigen